MDLLKPNPIKVSDQSGVEKEYIISKIPAVQAREIITQYPISAIPKIGDYKVNESIMFKLMSYVAVTLESGKLQRLTTQELINNHVPDYEVLLRLEAAMIDYNTSFFTKGTGSTFFALIAEKAKPKILEILTALQEQSSPKAAPPSTNSGPSTT